MEITTLPIVGMTTEQCAVTLANALKAVAGVEKADVSFFSNRAALSFDGGQTSVDALKQTVRNAGFEIKPVHGEEGVCCGGCGGE